VSSDAGGCLPCFDADGHVSHMDVGDAGALLATLAELVARGVPLDRALPAFTSNPARLLRLAAKGRIAVGADADLVVLDEALAAREVIVRGCLHVHRGEVIRRGQFESAG
jgi:beta-aspartyl-dipeptidase (metallo-type)